MKKISYRKIEKEEFNKLKRLFPSNDKLWIDYRNKRIKQIEKREADIFIIEVDKKIIGEITVNYKSNKLQTETIPNKRVYLETFRIDKKHQGKGWGQKLINYCIHYLEEQGYTEFTIGVEENNKIAKHIYFKLGFNKAIDKGHGDELDPSEYTLFLKCSKKQGGSHE